MFRNPKPLQLLMKIVIFFKSLIRISIFYISAYEFMYLYSNGMYECTCYNMQVEIRRQLCGVASLHLLLCWL